MAYIGNSLNTVTRIEYNFTAEDGQKVIKGIDENGAALAFDVNAYEVFLNGVLQGTDNFSGNGSQITFNEPLVAGDKIVIRAFQNFQYVNESASMDRNVYDPNNVNEDAFNLDNMRSGATNINYTVSRDESIDQTFTNINERIDNLDLNVDLSPYAKTADVDTKLETKADKTYVDDVLEDYVTETNLTTTLEPYAKLDDVATKAQGTKADTAVQPDVLEDYVTDAELTSALGEYAKTSNVSSTLNNFYVKIADLDTTLEDYVTNTNLTTNLEPYAKSADVDTKLGNKADKTYVDDALSDYVTNTTLNTQLGSKVSIEGSDYIGAYTSTVYYHPEINSDAIIDVKPDKNIGKTNFQYMIHNRSDFYTIRASNIVDGAYVVNLIVDRDANSQPIAFENFDFIKGGVIESNKSSKYKIVIEFINGYRSAFITEIA